MAIFFKSVSTLPGVAAPSGSRQIKWWIVITFITALLILLVFACYAGQIDKLKQLYEVLVHGIEVLIGLFAGIFIGEANK